MINVTSRIFFKSLKILFLFFFCTLTSKSYGVIERYAIVSQDLFNVTPANIYSCYDSKGISTLPFTNYSNTGFVLNTDFKFRWIRNRVKVSIDRSFTDFIPLDRDIRVKLEVNAQNQNGASIYTNEIIYLDLKYRPGIGMVEDESSSFRFEGAVVISVRVIDVLDFNGNPISNFNQANYPKVKLDTEIEFDRIYLFNPNTSSSTAFKSSVQFNNLIYNTNCYPDEHEVLWNQINGAEAWELEWQFIEDDYNAFTNFVTVDYRHNSTRVKIESFTSANPRFKIPGILEKGYIVFRVRPIGYDLNTFETVYGDWSMDDVTEGFSLIPPLALNVFEVQNYNEDLNWIRTTTFAEEAKYKSVVSYYDGILRQRQAITISTTDQMPIVAQTIYDFSGRPAIQVLPTPALDGNAQLCFRPAYNKNTNGQAYSYKDFDLTDGSNCPGPLVVSEMSNASGASKYYSSQGLTVNSSPWQSYVPDAQGYPFAQVEYTADNTGRIARSGMAGKPHRLSGVDQNNVPVNGKESRFYYGKPFQEQLYMMFGADVGNSEHYKRNVSIDPNGQASVTYIDPYGRTIATSLAGDPNNSPNLEALPSSSQYFDFKVSSFTNNIQGRSKVIQQSLIVTDAGMHSVRYTVDPRAFSPICAPEGVCYDCVYDLEISLLNECGEELIPVDKRKTKVGNIQPFDLDCDAVGFTLVPDGSLDLLLQPGQYTLRKTLTVNKDALNYYRRAMLSNNTCIRSLSEFIDEEKEQMGLRDNCLYTCLDCQYELNQMTLERDDLLALGENLTTIQENRLDELQSMIQHQQELCNELCKVPTPCDILLESILADMRLGGQYATTLGYDQQTGILTPNLNDNYSIFNEQNQLLGSCQNANWRHPRNPEINGSQTDDYYNQDGSLALIKVINDLPEIQAGKSYYDVNGNEYSGNGAAFRYIKPKDLKNVEDFIDQYMVNPAWAHSLKQYHPEYCLYKKCKLIEPTYEYNNKMLAEDDAQQALLKGYFNPVNNSDVTYSATSNTDPYASQEDPLKSEKEPLFGDDLNMLDFNSTGLAWFKNHLWDYPVNGLNPGKSIWDLYNDYNQSHTLSQSELECTGDPGWPFLRALYIAAKDDILRDYYLSTSNCQPPYISCPTCNSNSGGCQGQISIPEGKLRRFPLDASAIQGIPLSMQSGDADDFNEGKDFVDSKVQDQCQSKCDSYKEYWARQLQGCSLFVNLSQVQKDNMLSDLSKVCVEGCDIDNPLGSRQVSPKNLSNLAQGEPSDFHQVFVLYFGSGAWLDPNVCDELILEWPLDYGHDYSAYDGPYSDTCACNKKAYATSNPNCSPNTIPEPLEDCACEIKDPAVRQATLMKKDIPDELKCQNCVDCRRFNIAYARFELRYGSTAIGQMNDALFEALLEKWMNLDLGFNLKYSDYLTFAGQCKQISSAPDRQIWTNFKEVRWVIDEKNKGKELQLDDSSIYFMALNTFLKDLNLSYSGQSDSLVINMTSPERIQSNPEGMIAATDEVFGIDMSSASTDADKLACHCEKILTARWYKDKELQRGNIADDKGVYERMFGPGPFTDQAEFDKAYKVCCNAYYESVPANPDCQQTGFKPGDKFSSTQKNYFDNHVLSPNTDPAFVNNGVNDHQLMIDANCNNPLTTDYTLAPADNCACDKLMAAKQAYENLYPGHYGSANPPLNTPTFEQYIQSQYGVTGYDLVKITEKCIKNWNSGSGEDPNGQPNPWPGIGATWSKISKENLAQDVMDDDLKVPQGLLCQNPPPPPQPCRSFPPDCYTLRWVLKEFLAQTTLPAGINLGNPYTQGTPEYGAYNFYSSWESFYELFMNNKYSSNPDPTINAFFDAFAAFANSHSLVKAPCNDNANYSTTELIQKFKACLPLPCKPTCSDFESIFSGFLEEMAGQIALPSGLTTSSNFKDFYEGAKSGYYNDNDWKGIIDNFLIRANFIVNQRCPKSNSDIQYTFTQIWGMLWHCFSWGGPEGIGQEQTKPVCTTCFTVNYEYLSAFEKFLNQINLGRNDYSNSTVLDKLQFDNWLLMNNSSNNNADRFYNSILYVGNSQSTLRYHIDENSYGVPFMEVLIDDANGFKFGYTLEFPGKDDVFNYGMIREFKNIRPLGRINCGLPKGFEVDVIIKIGDAYVQQNASYTMTGTFTFGAYADYTECFDTCVRLCNKPLIPKPVMEEDPCEKVLLRVAYSNALMKYHDYLDELDKQFEADYVEYCMGATESLELEYSQQEYHFTLYQYDQAGNLIKTIPPEGVDFTYTALNSTQRTQLIQERIDKAKTFWLNPLNVNSIKPKLYHTLATHYKYNTLNQIVWQLTPDGGESKFWYDALGRLVVSQDARQYAQNKYSYILFDDFGRSIETGQKATSNAISPSIAATKSSLLSFMNSGSNTEVSRTLFDAEHPLAPVNLQFQTPRTALRGRVIGTFYYRNTPPSTPVYFGEGCDAATHFGYDIHGNVTELVQEIPLLFGLNNQFKRVRYEFDLLSGKTNKVLYQEGSTDQLFHRFNYNGDNKLLSSETSRDDWDYKLEAKYFYYLHGPLARIELGTADQKVQGLDYAYGLNGWLKALNASSLDPVMDMGKDGNPAVLLNSKIARDGFAFMLGYHDNDYLPVGGAGSDFRPSIQAGSMANAIKELFNGNISFMQTSLPEAATYLNSGTLVNSTLGNVYHYDQLNRLVEHKVFDNYSLSTNNWPNAGLSGNDKYHESFTYDATGNILSLTRNGDQTSTLPMDDFTYKYSDVNDISNKIDLYSDVTNTFIATIYPKRSHKLYHVNDNVSTSNYSDDIDDQGAFNSTYSSLNSANNYGYDELGNLIRDNSEEIASIEWNSDGKISKVLRTSGSNKPELEYLYDASGSRLVKIVKPRTGGNASNQNDWKYTIYVKDGSGNILAIYELTYEELIANQKLKEILKLKEQHIYAGSRLGLIHDELLLSSQEYNFTGYNSDGSAQGMTPVANSLYQLNLASVPSVFTYQKGEKQYELSNHLGNVMVTISDRWTAVDDNADLIIDYYIPDVMSIADYYAFGSKISNRSMDIVSSRFGFNNQEQETELGDYYSFEYRVHDARLGRFLSVDPLSMKFPSKSTYDFSSNNPIFFVEVQGKFPHPFQTMQIYRWINENVIVNMANAPFILGSGLFCSASNAISVGYNEGIHEGSARNRNNQLFYHNVYMFDKNWNIIPLYGENNFNGATWEAGKLILGSVFDIVPVSLPLKSTITTAIKITVNASNKIIAKYLTGEFLQITAKSAKLWGGNIISLFKSKTTTVIGKYRGGVEFIKASGKFRYGQNTGGINILNESDEVYKKTILEGGEKLFFERYNKPWLDEAILRGDNIRLVSDPYDISNRYKDGNITMFGREIEHLISNGYKFENGWAIKK